MAKGFGQRRAEAEALVDREIPAPVDLGFERARGIGVDLRGTGGGGERTARGIAIGQLHDVIEERLRAADVQDIDKALVIARHGLEARHSLELAGEGALVFKGAAIDDLDRAISAGVAAREPDLAIRPAANDAEDRVIRYRRC